MKINKILELDWSQPFMDNGKLAIKNHYVFRDHYEYDAQDIIDLDGAI